MPVDTSESLDNMPELVVWIGIVPALGQRYSPRETAEDEENRCTTDYRPEPFFWSRTEMGEIVGHRGKNDREKRMGILTGQPFLK